MKIPYGISNFGDLRRGGFFYVDKTPFLPRLESAEAGYRHLLFLRPRRIGKSLLLSLLEHYYDIGRAPQFDELFRGLWIHENPTPERSRYLVLSLDFSSVATDGGIEALRRTFYLAIRSRVLAFLIGHRGRIPELDRIYERLDQYQDSEGLLVDLMSIVLATGYKLYVLIDEYDNFANRLLSDGAHDLYESIVMRTGFVRTFYATLKTGTGSGAVGRIFITGVSPILLDDLSSGFNIVTHISNHSRFNTLAGFTHSDVERMVDEFLAGRPDLSQAPGLSDRKALLDVLERYYNGYRFSEGAAERVFNSDMVLYFLRELENQGSYPTDMLDLNVRTDYRRLQRIGTLAGTAAPERRKLLESILTDGYVDAQLVKQFGAGSLSSREQFVSLLYYLGMLTLGQQPADSAVPRLEIPNRVIRELQWEHLAMMLKEQDQVTVDTTDLEVALQAMAVRGDMGPFVELFHSRAVKAMGLKDLRQLNEKSLKLMLMAFISLSRMFHVLSEKEFAQGYCDLFLGASRYVPGAKYAWLLELKYLPTDAESKAIEGAFAQAEKQIERYASDRELLPMLVQHRSLKAGTLVFVGARELLFRPWEGSGAGTENTGRG